MFPRRKRPLVAWLFVAVVVGCMFGGATVVKLLLPWLPSRGDHRWITRLALFALGPGAGIAAGTLIVHWLWRRLLDARAQGDMLCERCVGYVDQGSSACARCGASVDHHKVTMLWDVWEAEFSRWQRFMLVTPISGLLVVPAWLAITCLGDHRSTMPACCRRASAWLTVGTWAGLIGGGLILSCGPVRPILSGISDGTAVPTGIMLLAWATATSLTYWVWGSRLARTVREAVAEGKMPCERCLYWRVPEQENCPECGDSSPLHKSAVKWRVWRMCFLMPEENKVSPNLRGRSPRAASRHRPRASRK